MRKLSLLILFYFPLLVVAQTRDDKPKKLIGQSSLAIDFGLFRDASVYLDRPSYGFVVGVEKKRHRFTFGPMFGKNTFYPEPNENFGLSGFIIDYSFTFFQPIKQLNLSLFTQFQYHYQDRVIYLEPPAQDFFLSSQYKEEMYGMIGLEARINPFRNFCIFGKLGLGFRGYKTQIFYPYHPDGNSYYEDIALVEMKMFGMIYAFPTKKRSSTPNE